MTRSFFVFAAGLPGMALLLLRCSVATFLIALPYATLGSSPGAALAVDGLAVLLVIGLRTRIIALAAFAVAAMLATQEGAIALMPLVAHALDAVVLAMAGPGAYSIDSRLFGRQTLRLPG